MCQEKPNHEEYKCKYKSCRQQSRDKTQKRRTKGHGLLNTKIMYIYVNNYYYHRWNSSLYKNVWMNLRGENVIEFIWAYNLTKYLINFVYV